jgi:hypothetical protein
MPSGLNIVRAMKRGIGSPVTFSTIAAASRMPVLW